MISIGQVKTWNGTTKYCAKMLNGLEMAIDDNHSTRHNLDQFQFAIFQYEPEDQFAYILTPEFIEAALDGA